VSKRNAFSAIDVGIALVIVAAIVVAAVALLQTRAPEPDDPAEAPGAIDPALICYQETGRIDVDLEQARALAVGPEGNIHVAGDKSVRVLDSSGAELLAISLEEEPRCLAVGGSAHEFPGRMYVGSKHHVEVFDADGKPVASWPSLGEKANLTSIGLAPGNVFLADAGNQTVWHCDTSGGIRGEIGKHDPQRKITGFIVTSPYFDLAVSPEAFLHVVNPRTLGLEIYTFDGTLESSWRRPETTIEGFQGCCNPIHFALLSDGRYVTAEKGRPRVKIYDTGGRFECVVAGPDQVAEQAADVAVDDADRVLILDAKNRAVRIFAPKQSDSGETSQ